MEDEEEVPIGFRFYPTEEELVSFYLHNKLNQTRPEIDRVIPVVDVYDYNPSDLPRIYNLSYSCMYVIIMHYF